MRRRIGAAPRSLLGGASRGETGGARHEWAADEELRLISLSADLAELLGIDIAEVGRPAADAHPPARGR